MGGEDRRVILVTGGAGFIGSHTVVELLEVGYIVVVLDDLSNAASGNMEECGDQPYLPPSLKRVQSIVADEFKNNISFVNGSYADEAVLKQIFTSQPIYAIVHFGGFKAVGESKELPLKYYQNNLMGTMSLMKAMKKYNVKKLIFSSSATVYTEVAPEDLPYTEESKVGQCTCAYASTKYFLESIFEDLCKAESDAGWKIMALRYFNPVGAHHTGKIGEDPKGIPFNLMPFIAQVAVGRRECLNIFGTDYPTVDGTGVRDYIHIVDVAKGHVAALKALDDMKGFRAYNLGTGKGTSVKQMVEIFQRVTGVTIPVKIQPRRAGDVPSMYCDPSRAWRDLQWRAEKSVEQMCEDLWRFQSNNPNGYQD